MPASLSLTRCPLEILEHLVLSVSRRKEGRNSIKALYLSDGWHALHILPFRLSLCLSGRSVQHLSSFSTQAGWASYLCPPQKQCLRCPAGGSSRGRPWSSCWGTSSPSSCSPSSLRWKWLWTALASLRRVVLSRRGSLGRGRARGRGRRGR